MRTLVPNKSAKSRAGREWGGVEWSGILLAALPLAKIPSRARISSFAAKSFMRAPTPASCAGYDLFKFL